MCIPSPATLHFRLEPNAIVTKEYADRDAIFDDLANAYKQAIRGFYDAGCRYLQFDDTAWAYLCSQAELKKARERGLNADRLQQDYARVINGALEGKPADMTVTTHVCRGNFRSTWISEGGYEPVAEIMLGKLNYDGYFLEYDQARAGGFEPLRFLPKGNKIVVLGLITTKSGTLEKKDDVKRRIEEATKFAAARSACSVAAMRLCFHRRRQCARRGRAMGEAADGGGTGQRGVGLTPPAARTVLSEDFCSICRAACGAAPSATSRAAATADRRPENRHQSGNQQATDIEHGGTAFARRLGLRRPAETADGKLKGVGGHQQEFQHGCRQHHDRNE